MLGFGDASKAIYCWQWRRFRLGHRVNKFGCLRPLICSNNSTIYGYNITNNMFAGPVTLVGGNVNLNANFYTG